MPTFDNVTTQSSRQIWSSPDGQRVIYEVTLEYQGKQMKAKTYSKAITEQGRVGSVETYEKEGKQGAETFVKQPQQGSFGGGYQSTKSTGASGSSTTSSRDDSHIRAQWAIGQAVAIANQQFSAEGAMPLSEIEALATDFFHMVNRVKVSEVPVTDEEMKPENVKAAIEDLPSTEELDKMFGTTEQVQLGDAPWGK